MAQTHFFFDVPHHNIKIPLILSKMKAIIVSLHVAVPRDPSGVRDSQLEHDLSIALHHAIVDLRVSPYPCVSTGYDEHTFEVCKDEQAEFH